MLAYVIFIIYLNLSPLTRQRGPMFKTRCITKTHNIQLYLKESAVSQQSASLNCCGVFLQLLCYICCFGFAFFVLDAYKKFSEKKKSIKKSPESPCKVRLLHIFKSQPTQNFLVSTLNYTLQTFIFRSLISHFNAAKWNVFHSYCSNNQNVERPENPDI